MTRMIGYLRVSTEEQASSGLGLTAQRETIQRYADQHGWDIVWYQDAGLSAKSLDRPALQEALSRLHLKKRDVDGLVVAKLYRLSRSVQGIAGLLELARARRWSLVAIDLGVDTSTPTGELIANLKLQLDEFRERVKQSPGEVQIEHRPGYSGGGATGGWLAGLLALLAAVRCFRRRA